MLTKRIIACLDVDEGRVVKGVKFLNLRDAGDPAELAAAHSQSGADEIVLLDISATAAKRKTLLDTVRQTARRLFIPFTVGGGIRSLEDASAVFDAGADKVSVNSAALSNPELITSIADRFGSQAVIVAIDAKRVKGGGYEAFVSGGRTPTGRDAQAWANEAESRGAGEILLTSMDRDGTGDGFDCDLTRSISMSVRIPVIASGGAGSTKHFTEVFREGHADAALAASILHYGTTKLGDLKQDLAAAGIPMRWPC
jgi:imidazole glycerol-phosphate synthase subunit HisF